MRNIISVTLLLVIIGTTFFYSYTALRDFLGMSNELISSSQNQNGSSVNINYFQKLSLKANDQIESPLTITGEARGSWFFEGSFPVTLVDGNRKNISQGIAVAKTGWMTIDFVPFELKKLTFIKPINSSNGILIFRKDNPSGLPQNDVTFELPITFK
jgi:hypothetical protein